MSPNFDVPAHRTRSVSRPRVMELLNSASAHSAMIIVEGGAGSGKSTAVAQWAAATASPEADLVWVILRPDDAGADQFWTRVSGVLIATVLDDDSSLHSDLIPSGQHVLPALRAAMDRHPRPITVVLDDFHLVESDAIGRQLESALRDLPGFRLVVISRTASYLSSTEVATGLATGLVPASDLLFTPDECEQLAASVGASDVAALGSAIHRTTLGWPLGSQALAVEAHRDRREEFLAGGLVERSQFVREFVARSIEGRIDERRQFLLRIALADECSAEIASEMTGLSCADSEAELAQLEADGIGSWQRRTDAVWFRLHPLIQEELNAVAERNLTPEDVARIRSLLALRIHRSRPLRALELALAAQDWPLMTDLLLQHWTEYEYYYREGSEAAFAKVPRAVARQQLPILVAEVVRSYRNPERTGDDLVRAFAHLSTAVRNEPQRPGVLGALREAMYQGTYRLFGDMKTAQIHADRVASSLKQATPAELLELETSLPVLHVQVGITWLFNTNYLRALDSFARANSASQNARVSERFQAMSLLALTNALRGDIRESKVWLDRCDAADPYDGWRGGYVQAGYHLATAVAALNEWHGPRALTALDAITPIEHVTEYWPHIAMIRAQADLLEFGAARAHTTLMETLTRKSWRPAVPEALRAILVARSVRLLLLAGQTSRAETELMESSLREQPDIVLARAHLAWVQRKYATALSLADSVTWNSAENPQLRAESLILQAVAALDDDQPERASGAFTEAVSEMTARALKEPLLLLPRGHLERLVELSATVDELLLDDVPSIAHPPRAVEVLSKAERRVLSAIAKNPDVPEVAALLHLSEHTVRYHLKRSYRKLGVSGRSDAIRVATELGMLDLT